MEVNKLYNTDCMSFMKTLPNNSVDIILTDIPYGEVTRESRGLTNLDRGNGDIETFDTLAFVKECYRIAKSSITIFCGMGQLSTIHCFFAAEQKKRKGTVRELAYSKTNPVPSNGQYVYLSSIEMAVWFRKSKGTFNAHCKGTVFNYPIWGGKNRIHPTEKHHGLIKEIMLDNSNEGDLVFDPCAGSGSTLLVAKQNNRNYLGCELDKEYYDKAIERLKNYE